MRKTIPLWFVSEVFETQSFLCCIYDNKDTASLWLDIENKMEEYPYTPTEDVSPEVYWLFLELIDYLNKNFGTRLPKSLEERRKLMH